MRNVLLLLKLPPPIHGSTLMNSTVASSSRIKNAFNTTVFGVSISKDTTDIGRFSLRKVWTIINDYSRLFQQIKKQKPELTYFTLSPIGSAFLKDFVFIAIIKAFKIPIVFHLHGKGIRRYEKKSLYRKLYRYAFKGSRAIILAKELASDIEMLPFKNTYTVANGIAPVVKKSDIATGVTTKKSVRLMYLSNFVKSKGIIEFLKACALLKQRTSDFSICIIGKPIDVSTEFIESFLEEQGLRDKVSFLGPAYNEQKFDLMLQSDIFVFPTYYENECVPLVLLEAMQCGLPIVTSKEGGIPSIVKHGHNGLLVDPRKETDIAQAIESLIASPGKRKEMGENGRKEYEANLTVEAFEKNLTNVITQILEEV